MRTTLELDRKLLERAKKALGTRSFTATIEKALQSAVSRSEAREGWDALIESDLSWGSVDEFLEFRRLHGSRRGSVA